MVITVVPCQRLAPGNIRSMQPILVTGCSRKSGARCNLCYGTPSVCTAVASRIKYARRNCNYVNPPPRRNNSTQPRTHSVRRGVRPQICVHSVRRGTHRSNTRHPLRTAGCVAVSHRVHSDKGARDTRHPLRTAGHVAVGHRVHSNNGARGQQVSRYPLRSAGHAEATQRVHSVRRGTRLF